MYTCLKLDIYIYVYSDIRSGIHSDIFSGILSGIIKILPANSEGCYLLDIYFWHRVSCFCHLACHGFVIFLSFSHPARAVGSRADPESPKTSFCVICLSFVLSCLSCFCNLLLFVYHVFRISQIEIHV
jgi:hypothetical protein